MKIVDILNKLDNVFPVSLQEDYDNCGNQVIFRQNDLSGILLCLDVTIDIINEAINNNSNLIISHHPLIFQPIKKIDSNESMSGILIHLIQNDITLYSMHTNLDKLYYDKLSNVLGFKNKGLLIEKSSGIDNGPSGFGTISELSKPVLFKEMLNLVKDKLNQDFLMYTGNLDNTVKIIAVLNGSGGGSVEKIIKNFSIDCIITGDVGYHHYKYAIDNSIPIIDAGHFGTEKILIDFLYKEVNDCLMKLEAGYKINVIISGKEKNPFNVYK